MLFINACGIIPLYNCASNHLVHDVIDVFIRPFSTILTKKSYELFI